ncbi:MAG: hypothetical protein RRA94_03235 [Bacteroidota bacterium]|nr:hypothetical protein [Bacteroidota bacterium]
MSGPSSLGEQLRRLLDRLDAVQRHRAVDAVEWEYDELRHVFALLVMGQAVGLPSPPVDVMLALLPEMEEELRILLRRLDTAQAPFSQLFSSLPSE